MQSAGVTKAFVIDQDFLAHDDQWEGLTYRQIRQYLKAHPEWQVSFVGLNGFTEQPGFIELLSSKLLHQINTAFPEVSPHALCVVLPSQGVPVETEASPGCGVARIRAAMKKLQSLLPGYNLTLVFTNHGEGHGGPWSAPSDKIKVPEIATDYPCSHVLTSPILQWPQTDYTVYVFQGNGSTDEPGYSTLVKAAGKEYRHMPAWDLAEEHWDMRPPQAGAIALSAIDTALPDFTARIVADVLAGRHAGYDLTLIDQSS